MRRKAYKELKLIRKELQAIRYSLEKGEKNGGTTREGPGDFWEILGRMAENAAVGRKSV